jgi:hypothetical protein
VVGWRVWSLSADDGRARLGSHVSPTVWQPGRELVATCDARRRELRRPWRLHPTGHAAPAPRCTCGVHAMGNIRYLATYLTPAARPYAWLRPLVHHVIGRVALWGDVVEGSRGWRAAERALAATARCRPKGRARVGGGCDRPGRLRRARACL